MAIGSSCFISPINRAPEVRSIDMAGPFQRGQEAQFTATVTDPDGDQVDLSWGVDAGDCKPKNDSSQWPPRTATSTYTVKSEYTNGTFCVWAFATDRYGAIGVNNRAFSAGDRPPVAQIDAGPTMAHYRLYSTFKVDGSSSYDPDGDNIKSYQWDLQSPSGASLSFQDCDGGDPKTTRCFRANQAGVYTVSLKVFAGGPASEPGVMSAAALVKLDVLDDTFPCLEAANHDLVPMTTVPLNPHDDQNNFQITFVDDDGDQFPPVNGTEHLTFSWFMTPPGAPPGSPLVAQDTLLNTLMIAKDQFELTDETVVRVEIHDRQVEAIDRHLRECGDAPICGTTDPITNKACYQRFSWNVKWIL